MKEAKRNQDRGGGHEGLSMRATGLDNRGGREEHTQRTTKDATKKIQLREG